MSISTQVFMLERFEMNISSSSPISPPLQPTTAHAVPPEEIAHRREVVQAAKTVNSSGILGQNQLVFSVDRATHRLIIRVVDRDTHEVVLQLPPEYVMRLAQNVGTGSAHIPEAAADTEE